LVQTFNLEAFTISFGVPAHREERPGSICFINYSIYDYVVCHLHLLAFVILFITVVVVAVLLPSVTFSNAVVINQCILISSFSGIQVRGNLFATMANVWPILTLDPSSTNTATLPDFSDESLILEEVQNSVYWKSKDFFCFNGLYFYGDTSRFFTTIAVFFVFFFGYSLK
jgi:hypothetical protein